MASFLNHTPGVDLRTTDADSRGLARVVERHKPQVALVDLATFAARAGDIERTAVTGVRCRVLLLAPAAEGDRVVTAMRSGAWGVLYLDAQPAQLVALVLAAAAGRAWEDLPYAAEAMRSLRSARAGAIAPIGPGPSLSLRERQLIAELTAGATNADIAHTLGLRPQTVKNRLSAIFDKLGVSSRLELALYAVNHQLVERPDA
jgi:DNA-binding NarL/FixJ family response regulator